MFEVSSKSNSSETSKSDGSKSFSRETSDERSVKKLSGWPVVTQTNSMNAKNLCKILRDHFTNLGVPQRMRTDGGPQFTSYTFKKFMEKFNVEHVVSSPHYSQSNGHAEAAVKSMKKLIAKTTTHGNIDNDDFCNGLLEYRNTPRKTGYSPAEILFGHHLRSIVPAHRNTFKTKWKDITENLDKNWKLSKEREELYYNRKAKEIRKVMPNEEVFLQEPVTKLWTIKGRIVGIGKHRKYLIKTTTGSLFWRNRIHIIPTKK